MRDYCCLGCLFPTLPLGSRCNTSCTQLDPAITFWQLCLLGPKLNWCVINGVSFTPGEVLGHQAYRGVNLIFLDRKFLPVFDIFGSKDIDSVI